MKSYPTLILTLIATFKGVMIFMISWILKKYYFLAVALLSGFMIGSLNKVWPWKEAISFRFNSHGEQVVLQDKSILPMRYFDVTGNSPEILQALFFMALGIGVVVIIEKIALDAK